MDFAPLRELEQRAFDSISHHFVPSQEQTEVYLKRTVIPQGAWLQQHVHTYDHASILKSGAVSLSTDGGTTWQLYRAPAVLVLKAGTPHMLHALEEAVWYCIHPTDEGDPDKVDEVLIAPACCEAGEA